MVNTRVQGNVRPQLIATHTQLPNQQYAASTGGRTTDVQQQTRYPLYVGPSDVSQIQIGVVGFYQQQNSASGSTGIGNDFSYDVGIESAAPDVVMSRAGYFGGARTKTILNDSPLVFTDPINMALSAGSPFYIRQNVVISDPVNGKFFGTANAVGNNTLSPNSATQSDATGALALPSGGVTTYARHKPAIVVGIPKTPHASILVLGDSISDGQADAAANARGSIGYIQRGLDSSGLPFHMQAISGLQMESVTLPKSAKIRDFWPYCTHVLFALGYNDMATLTLAQMQAKATALLTELKKTVGPYGKPLHITAVSITPSATSSNSFVDAAGQTVAAAWGAAGGKRDLYNQWLASLVTSGVLLDDYINLTSVTDDPANYGKWFTNGTAQFSTQDGAHPKTGMVTRMSPLIQNWAAKLRP